MWYAETKRLDKWSPCTFADQPSAKRIDGTKQKIRAIQKIAAEHVELGLYDLQRLYAPGGELDPERAELALTDLDKDELIASLRRVIAEKDEELASLVRQPGLSRLPHLTLEQIRGAVGRAWCHPENSHKTVDPDLAEAVTLEIYVAFVLGGLT